MIKSSAPAKVILLGEHAVVFGKPAIAVPVSSLRAYATVEPSEHGLHIAAPQLNQSIRVSVAQDTLDNALALTARLVLQHWHCDPPDITIRLHSDIPIASGLGSGAAVSAALARALCAALNIAADDTALNAIVYEVEKMHHGTPSGIDNTVVVYEQPVYFVRGKRLETLTIGKPFRLLVADTGIPASTRVAVAGVRALYDSQQAEVQVMLDEIEVLVELGRKTIEHGHEERLGALMTRNHSLLQQLTVSSSELDRLVNAALDAGALGAKLSGGGRGGNMIALITEETEHRVKAALEREGAARAFATTVQ